MRFSPAVTIALMSTLMTNREQLPLASLGPFPTTSWKLPPNTSQEFCPCGNVCLTSYTRLYLKMEFEVGHSPSRSIRVLVVLVWQVPHLLS